MENFADRMLWNVWGSCFVREDDAVGLHRLHSNHKLACMGRLKICGETLVDVNLSLATRSAFDRLQDVRDGRQAA